MLPIVKTPTKTPVKKTGHIAISPHSKTNKCLLCLKYEPNQDNRRKLWRGSTKTAACLLLEETLKITIDSVLDTEIVCKKCIREAEKIGKYRSLAEDIQSDLARKLRESQTALQRQYTSKETSDKRMHMSSPEHANSIRNTSRQFKRRPLAPLFDADATGNQATKSAKRDTKTVAQQTDDIITEAKDIDVCISMQ